MGPPRGLCVEAGLIETDLPPPNFPPWISLRRCRAVMPHAASTHPPASRKWIRRLVKFKFSRSCRLRRRKGGNGVRQGESPHNQPAEPLAERTDGDGGPFSPTTRSRSFFRARGEGGCRRCRRWEAGGGKWGGRAQEARGAARDGPVVSSCSPSLPCGRCSHLLAGRPPTRFESEGAGCRAWDQGQEEAGKKGAVGWRCLTNPY